MGLAVIISSAKPCYLSLKVVDERDLEDDQRDVGHPGSDVQAFEVVGLVAEGAGDDAEDVEHDGEERGKLEQNQVEVTFLLAGCLG